MPVLHNPIQPGFFPDPSIILVGDTYYMVTTTMHLMPGADTAWPLCQAQYVVTYTGGVQ